MTAGQAPDDVDEVDPLDDLQLPSIPGRPEWYDAAACRGLDPALFFPERGGRTVEAKALCSTCPVQGPCLDLAIVNRERHGIWGGLSERGRRLMRRRERLRQAS